MIIEIIFNFFVVLICIWFLLYTLKAILHVFFGKEFYIYKVPSQLIRFLYGFANPNYLKFSKIKNISDQKALADIALSSESNNIRIAAINRISNQEILINLERNDPDNDIKIAALKRIKDQKYLAKISKNENYDLKMRKIAVSKLTDIYALNYLVKNGSDEEIRIIASQNYNIHISNDKEIAIDFFKCNDNSDLWQWLAVYPAEKVKNFCLNFTFIDKTNSEDTLYPNIKSVNNAYKQISFLISIFCSYDKLLSEKPELDLPKDLPVNELINNLLPKVITYVTSEFNSGYGDLYRFDLVELSQSLLICDRNQEALNILLLTYPSIDSNHIMYIIECRFNIVMKSKNNNDLLLFLKDANMVLNEKIEISNLDVVASEENKEVVLQLLIKIEEIFDHQYLIEYYNFNRNEKHVNIESKKIYKHLFYSFVPNKNLQPGLDNLLNDLDSNADKLWRAISTHSNQVSELKRINLEISKNLKNLEPDASWILINRIHQEEKQSEIHNKALLGLKNLKESDVGMCLEEHNIKWWIDKYK